MFTSIKTSAIFTLSNNNKNSNKMTTSKNNHELKVGDILIVTFNNDSEFVNGTFNFEIVRVEEKRFYYKLVNGTQAIIGRAWSLFNRKSVKFTKQ